ncbi:XRE family transcriptional regulator [Photobacterium profundum]|uniref:Hypothetical transcriptional regulator n=1 Tax=Photobacterium profundum 3TCK TaxID=314280 RepID=Q1Z5B9_9GAMM|nr:helix-turn-helix transcriptional regulator [Photobacterium profundum]EAS43647.1 Hypothetical transcriptional regulator [Photobacterium profundum 3TCK]PSV64172.1 XRE family transcriptional regulator [Photobacterium profundum]
MHQYNKDAITYRIKECRERNNLTQEYIARKIKVSRKTYIDIEAGKTALKVSTLFDISDCLGCKISYLLGTDECEPSVGEVLNSLLKINGYKIVKDNSNYINPT